MRIGLWEVIFNVRFCPSDPVGVLGGQCLPTLNPEITVGTLIRPKRSKWDVLALNVCLAVPGWDSGGQDLRIVV